MKHFLKFFQEHPHLGLILLGCVLVLAAATENLIVGQLEIMTGSSLSLRWFLGFIGLFLILRGIFSPKSTDVAPSTQFSPTKIYRITSVFNQKVLDFKGNQTGLELSQSRYQSLANEQFRLIRNNGGYYRIQNKYSNLYLSVSDTNTNGTTISQQTVEQNDRQLWIIERYQSESFKIISKWSHKCLDVCAGNDCKYIQQWDFHENINQLWSIDEV
jgi:hypothetical protein